MPERALLRRWFSGLEGIWRIERRIAGKGSETARFAGEARFLAEAGIMRLEETGILMMRDGSRMPARRSWRWCMTGDGRLEIRFDDAGRRYAYHSMALDACGRGWEGQASHACGEDLYLGHYRFGADRLFIRQRLTGPAKVLTIASRYCRQIPQHRLGIGARSD